MKLAFVLSLALVFLVPSTDFAQTRNRRNTSRRPAARARRPAAASTTTINEARIRVTDEIKVLTRFLYLYGRTSVGVESNEQQARQGGRQLSPQAAAIVNRSRATIQQSIKDIRDRLDKLALSFRTTPGLEQYAQRITEVSASAAAAEQQATAGQLDAAGRALIEVANELTDVLLEL